MECTWFGMMIFKFGIVVDRAVHHIVLLAVTVSPPHSPPSNVSAVPLPLHFKPAYLHRRYIMISLTRTPKCNILGWFDCVPVRHHPYHDEPEQSKQVPLAIFGRLWRFQQPMVRSHPSIVWTRLRLMGAELRRIEWKMWIKWTARQAEILAESDLFVTIGADLRIVIVSVTSLGSVGDMVS